MTSKSDSNKTTPFIFTTCQVGAEPALKKEISREHPELKFAYSQPGFVTFKHTSAADLAKDFTLKSVFARSYGVSIGKSLDVPAVAKNLLSQIPATQKKASSPCLGERLSSSREGALGF